MTTTDSRIPFAEPPWLNGLPSPYYKDTHRKFQKACKAFIDEHMNDNILEWERAEEVPEALFHTFSKANMLVPTLPCPLPVEALHKMGIHDILGTPVAEFDYMHTSIYWQEMSRTGLTGTCGFLTTGHSFAIGPIYKFGSREMQDKWLPLLIPGKKRICIGITEPSAGSDVANVQTTAKKTPDGKHYIVNGEKKWITTGIFSDYCTMTVRTGGAGPKGLSVLLVPLKGHPGVSMRKIKIGGSTLPGTTYIELDNVKVPAENLIGKEGDGMMMIMTNFNHERLQIAVQTTQCARAALAAAFEYCMVREAFGKTLMDQPVVRHRLAKAGAELETLQAWVEMFCYQMCNLSKADADRELGGLTALAKAQAGRVFDECGRCAVLLFGGNGYTRTGQGELVERLYRDIPGTRIPGGSEDVLFDLSIRELVKNYKRKTGALKSGAKL